MNYDYCYDYYMQNNVREYQERFGQDWEQILEEDAVNYAHMALERMTKSRRFGPESQNVSPA